MLRRAGVFAVAALIALAGCRPAGPFGGAASPGGIPTSEPVVRVGVAVDAPRVEISASSPYELVVPGTETRISAGAGEVWTFTADEAGRVLGRSAAGRTLGPVSAMVRIDPSEGGRVLIDGRPFRGGALVRSAGPGRLTAVNLVALESYLLGVVPRELGPRPPSEIEAVKAQAVAARTYAIATLGSRERYGFDVFATIEDQVYGGEEAEDSVASRAVRETRGEVVTYRGTPILAYYHSTCGGRTAAVEEVWPRPPQPYLKSVSDEIGRSGRYYCDFSNRFRWSVTWSGAELVTVLARTLVGVAGAPPESVRRITNVSVTGRTPSNRVEAVRVVVDGGEYVIRGDSTRWLLAPPSGGILNSSRFELRQDRSGGEVVRLVVEGGGWGHGVGMCQVGAIGRARAGHDYRRILRAYYRDTEVTRLY